MSVLQIILANIIFLSGMIPTFLAMSVDMYMTLLHYSSEHKYHLTIGQGETHFKYLRGQEMINGEKDFFFFQNFVAIFFLVLASLNLWGLNRYLK